MGWLGTLGMGAVLWFLDGLIAWSKTLIVFGVVLLAVLSRFWQPQSLMEAVALAMGIFLALTPGFGVQYVVWLLPFVLLAAPGPGTAFNFFGSLFLANAFYEGQVNDVGMINPEVRVTIFSLLAWAAVLAFLLRVFPRQR